MFQIASNYIQIIFSVFKQDQNFSTYLKNQPSDNQLLCSGQKNEGVLGKCTLRKLAQRVIDPVSHIASFMKRNRFVSFFIAGSAVIVLAAVHQTTLAPETQQSEQEALGIVINKLRTRMLAEIKYCSSTVHGEECLKKV